MPFNLVLVSCHEIVNNILDPAHIRFLASMFVGTSILPQIPTYEYWCRCCNCLPASFLCVVVHHCMKRWSKNLGSVMTPATSAKNFHTFIAKSPLLKVCSIVSIHVLLQQQKQCVGSMPKVVSFSLVGSFPLKVLHNRKEALNGMFLYHI